MRPRDRAAPVCRLRSMVRADSTGLTALQAKLCAQNARASIARRNPRKEERRVKAAVPAEVQLALRRLLAKALVDDYLQAQKPVVSNDGEHPPPDANPKAGAHE